MIDAPLPLLLYDGLCGFCNDTVQFVLRHDRRGQMRFAPLQGELAQRVLAQHPELREVDSLILIVRGAGSGQAQISIRADAALGVVTYLGGAWRLTAVLRVIPRRVRDAAYDLFARHRYRLFERHETCPVPSAAHRTRFLP